MGRRLIMGLLFYLIVFPLILYCGIFLEQSLMVRFAISVAWFMAFCSILVCVVANSGGAGLDKSIPAPSYIVLAAHDCVVVLGFAFSHNILTACVYLLGITCRYTTLHLLKEGDS